MESSQEYKLLQMVVQQFLTKQDPCQKQRVQRVILHGSPRSGKSWMVNSVVTSSNVSQRAEVRWVSLTDTLTFITVEGETGMEACFRNPKQPGRPVIVVIDHLELWFPKSNEEGSAEGDDGALPGGRADSTRMGQFLFATTQHLRSEFLVIGIVTDQASAVGRQLHPVIARQFPQLEISLQSPNVLQRGVLLRTFVPQDTPAGRAVVQRAAAKTGGLASGDVLDVGKRLPVCLEAVDSEDCGSFRLHQAVDAAVSVGKHGDADPTALVDVPQVRWEDVMGLQTVKERLREVLVDAWRNRSLYRAANVTPATGVLLYGPPGTGKTMLAKAVATEIDATFVSMSIAQLVQGEVGESERIVEQLFNIAFSRAPAVVFLDEVQAVFGRRDGERNAHEVRLTAALLAQLDRCRHMYHERGIVVIGATNRPDLLDEAMLAAGRMDAHLEVQPPDDQARAALIERRLKNVVSPQTLDDLTTRLVGLSRGFCAADLDGALNSVGLVLLSESSVDIEKVLEQHNFSRSRV